MQFDIFEHSRDVMLRNDVVAAIERRDAVAARSAWQALQAAFAADDSLVALDTLASALERQTDTLFADPGATRAARLDLQQRIEPAARHMLGSASAAAWLAGEWQQLARRAARLPFRAECSDEHAASLLLRAGDWAAARAAVAGIESWRRIPAPLAWMTEACWRGDGLFAAWPLLAELAWLAPERLDAMARRLNDGTLQTLRRAFDAGVEGEGSAADLAWFPAYVPIERPDLAPRLAEAQPARGSAPEQAMRLVLELLRLERHGRHHEMVERRKLLRNLNAGLYAAYMKTR